MVEITRRQRLVHAQHIRRNLQLRIEILAVRSAFSRL
jgi:hypothetical protein